MNTNKTQKINYLKRIYSLFFYFIIITSILFYLIILPTKEKIKDLKNNIITQKIELEIKIDREKNKTKLNENLRKIEPEIGLLDEVYISRNKELEFITLLEGIAHKNKVTQTLNLKMEESRNVSSYKIIPLNIAIEGKYSNIIKYMEALESLNYYININSLNISLPKNSTLTKDPNSNSLLTQQNSTLTLETSTFWQ